MMPSASILRLIWATVDTTPPNDLLCLSDPMLVKRLLKHVTENILLNAEELCTLYTYLISKVSLIRDMAEFPLFAELS